MQKKILTALAVTLLGITMFTVPAHAGGQNYGTAWEEWGGTQWHGYVQVRASYNDGGCHAIQGYHRFTRQAGPYLDTGRMYTSRANGPWDTNLHSRHDWVWDSPLWGDRYTTRYNYNWFCH